MASGFSTTKLPCAGREEHLKHLLKTPPDLEHFVDFNIFQCLAKPSFMLSMALGMEEMFSNFAEFEGPLYSGFTK